MTCWVYDTGAGAGSPDDPPPCGSPVECAAGIWSCAGCECGDDDCDIPAYRNCKYYEWQCT